MTSPTSAATSPGGGPGLVRNDVVRRLAEQHADKRGPLMVVLHAVIEELGHVERADVETIGEVLNLSRADVHGVISFYKDFRTESPAAHSVVVCRAEACQANGAEALWAATRELLAGRSDVEVDEVFCLGNCALGPAAFVDGRLVGRLTAERVGAIAAGWSG